jgi:hypothetical protein
MLPSSPCRYWMTRVVGSILKGDLPIVQCMRCDFFRSWSVGANFIQGNK